MELDGLYWFSHQEGFSLRKDSHSGRSLSVLALTSGRILDILEAFPSKMPGSHKMRKTLLSVIKPAKMNSLNVIESKSEF